MSCSYYGDQRIIMMYPGRSKYDIGDYYDIRDYYGRAQRERTFTPPPSTPAGILREAINDLEQLALRERCEDIAKALPVDNSLQKQLVEFQQRRIELLELLRHQQAKMELVEVSVPPTAPKAEAAGSTSSLPAAVSASATPTGVTAEDNHRALQWTEDLPATQLEHMWTEHRQSYPQCSECTTAK
jgi:hypothetical protein